MNETERMKELVKKLNEAAKAYYQEDREIMSNLEYDTLYDELQVLEEKTGVTLAGSPTTKVGYEAMDELPKEAHESPMLSLDKTKDVEVLRSFIGDHKTLLSWKMDGLTVVLTYRGGTLAKAVTRGNGVIGEVVTNNAKVFENIPLKIPYQGELVLRGEAIIRYSDFEKINEEIEDVDAKYKNPRNLCSGSVRQSDGLVALYDDIAYGESLGTTAKFPRNAFAFKWADEQKETTLLEIEWSPSRTGLINPVAVFEPVELEGTSVSRASVHNISIMRSLDLGVGDKILVYKANMIIPQIAENLTRSGVRDIPETCPACGGATRIQMMNNVETLYCTNPECPAKFMKAFTLFVSRDAMNIDGMSEATLEKFVGHGFIREFADIFRLDRYRDEIVEMDGFGEKSYQNLIDSIERAKNTTLPRLIFGLGILNIGLANARMICKAFDFDLDRIRNASAEDFAQIDGVGEVIAKSIVDYFADEENKERLERLLSYLTIEKPQASQEEQKLAGLTFVITGSVEHFPNRNALKARIEELGGKATGSVTGKTSYLINNDTTSSSSKNRKARELGVPVISEEEFLKMTEE